jgi:hypothetical protein
MTRNSLEAKKGHPIPFSTVFTSIEDKLGLSSAATNPE